MRRSLVTVALVAGLTLVGTTTAHADPAPRCQYDVTGTTVIVLVVPGTPSGTPVTVERVRSHTWHRIARTTTARTTTAHLHHRATQATLRVRVGAMRCETT